MIDVFAAIGLGFKIIPKVHPAEMAVWATLLTGVVAAWRWNLPRLQAICGGLLRLLVFLMAIGVLQYLAAVVPEGSADAAFDAIDRHLGFDWMAYYGWTVAHPGIASFLNTTYLSFGWEIPYVILLLGMIEPKRVGEFVTTLIVGLVLTVPFLCLLPVSGPFVFYGHTDIPQAFYTEHYAALRSGAMRAIDLSDLRGIVSFPSFHASGALLCAFGVTGYRWVFWPMLALNAVVMVATPVMGGHYLVDIIGGFAVAGATAVTVRHFYGPRGPAKDAAAP
jgi:membrane-associated phospholipid phosphatase